MYQGSSLLAFVPARGGSKGLPNKNILECAGKPLIEWTISAARAVGFIDDVLVSTDSTEIAEVSMRAGASVPFLRPPELATDAASLGDAISHAWESHTAASGKRFDYIIVLQPTSPLRTAAHIDAAIEFYFRNRRSAGDTLASVYQVGQKFGWLMQTEHESPYIRFCMDVSLQNPQRQALKPYYLPNGAIFMVRGDALAGGLYTSQTLPFVMDAKESIDIDTREDFLEAEKRLCKAE